ncbi:hypothetical protein N7462_000882 [Penicillium macrosclerotiorum]|uniref:uncharacterized protein n=1 Tax=Penicillium macrosclerotiorum TaxID=303699 RepID=UPI002549895C|nr:uncharacterized protein N7462_000882 [Penicillium macrosclerotiorum]KAJ5698877.1 hypothetical protein N7462_000882 [Penicillium macrosclerotiorum]
MSSEWCRLHLSRSDVPPLLVQYTWTRQAYELYLTDLTSIWSERLSHKDILKRADETATTIDPSEGAAQLDMFLTKIGDALCGKGGSVSLNSGSATNSIELLTSTNLPSPLQPLQWTLQLKKQPPSSMTDHLLLPLLRDEAIWESRQQSLVDKLKQKDWVLGKLFDKFDALGADLGTVFPSAPGLRSGRKGNSRSEAAKHIKGVAEFDQQAWLTDIETSSSNTASNFVREISRTDSKLHIDTLKPAPDQWWSGLPKDSKPISFNEDAPLSTGNKAPDEEHPKTKLSQGDIDLDGDTTAGSDDDEFERPESPPRLRKPHTKPTTPPLKQESTPKQTPTQKSSSPPAPTDAGEATATESESEPDPIIKRPLTAPSPPLPPPPQPNSPPKKPKSGLGIIGGKKKQPAKAPTPPSASPSSPSQPVAPPKRPAKLGMIGGKAKPNPPPHTEEPSPPAPAPGPGPEATRSVSPKTEAGTTPVEETEAQRADRRREELKRQLEAKSKAPVKKKRRF